MSLRERRVVLDRLDLQVRQRHSDAQIFSLGLLFRSRTQALAAVDGPLGAYVRKELSSKGVYIFEKTLETAKRIMARDRHALKELAQR